MIAYQFGALTATIIIWLLLLQLVHWIVREDFPQAEEAIARLAQELDRRP